MAQMEQYKHILLFQEKDLTVQGMIQEKNDALNLDEEITAPTTEKETKNSDNNEYDSDLEELEREIEETEKKIEQDELEIANKIEQEIPTSELKAKSEVELDGIKSSEDQEKIKNQLRESIIIAVNECEDSIVDIELEILIKVVVEEIINNKNSIEEELINQQKYTEEVRIQESRTKMKLQNNLRILQRRTFGQRISYLS
jgi:hypothetical protein